MRRYWPGALTIIVKATNVVPEETMARGEEVGIRVPNCPELQKLISELSIPLVATSANFKGDPPPIKHANISKDFLKLVEFSIKEDSTGEQASTVIRYLGDGKFEYLRKGAVDIKAKSCSKKSEIG